VCITDFAWEEARGALWSAASRAGGGEFGWWGCRLQMALPEAINLFQDQFTMLEHKVKRLFEMTQQVSCERGVMSAAFHHRDPRSLSSDTLPPFSNVPSGLFKVAAFHL
jgi:hypothetical protein